MNQLRIYLTGFMTSGKSTIGPILANVLGYDFFDLDKEIEKKESKTIVEIFEQDGEGYFRKIESEMLKQYSQLNKVIISLGGGTITVPENLELMKVSGKIVYLKVAPHNLYKRLKNKIDRPLFRDLVLNENSEEDFVNRIKEMLEKRKSYYEKADFIINTDYTPIGVTVDKLATKLLRYLNEQN